jgi:hypothetical protein
MVARMRNELACAASLLALAAGCAQGSSGALGQTQTSAACPPSDLVCAVSGIDAPISKGATLPIDVKVTSEGSATPPLSFVSANSSVFKVHDARIHAIGKGLASMLVMTEGELVVDFLHVWVSEADALRLHRVTQGGLQSSPLPASMQVLVGDQMTLVAAPHRGAQRLLGELDASFDADPAVVKLLDEGVPGSRRLVAAAAGTTTIIVEALGIKVQLALEVVP